MFGDIANMSKPTTVSSCLNKTVYKILFILKNNSSFYFPTTQFFSVLASCDLIGQVFLFIGCLSGWFGIFFVFWNHQNIKAQF